MVDKALSNTLRTGQVLSCNHFFPKWTLEYNAQTKDDLHHLQKVEATNIDKKNISMKQQATKYEKAVLYSQWEHKSYLLFD